VLVPALFSFLTDYWRNLQVSIWAELLLAAVGLYLVLVALGRLLKYRLGSRLGQVYQLFCATAGPYLAVTLLKPDLPGGRELGALTALLGAGVSVRLLEQYFWHSYVGRKHKTVVPKVIRELSAVFVVLAVLLLVLHFDYGLNDFKGVLAASGLVSIILGFALQDSLGNIIGGLAIQVGRPFQVGDWLLIDHQAVQAVEINWRSTRFVTNDLVQLDVPNQQIVRGTITNYHGGGHGHHAMRLEVGVQYDAPPNRVREILAQAAAAAPGVLKDPAPNVFLKSFGDSAIVYEVRYWMGDHRKFNIIADSVHTNIWYALRRQHLQMPFPMRTVQIERIRQPQVPAEHRRDASDVVCEVLRRQGLFKSMKAEHIKMIVNHCRSQHYGVGETIIREGADGASMFVLVTGEASVSVDGSGGEPALVATLRGGDCFGEMSLLTGEKRSANVIALSDCEVIEITKDVFGNAVQRDSELLMRLSSLLAHRKMQTDSIVEAQALAQQPGLLAAKEEEYREGFLHTLRSLFEL
jgi:small-conductance mechanosensitive channel/CRP-like cAMP-binding protein